MATLRVPDVVPSPVEDAEQLQKAFEANEASKRFTSSNKLLLEIATSRSSRDLLLVKQAYHVHYKKSLEEDVAYHTSGDLLKEVPAECDAFLANEATKRFTSSNKLLLEIATSRSSHDLLLVKQAYHVRYKKSLEDVAYHISRDLLKGDEISMPLAKKEAKIHNEKISDKAYDDVELIRILSARNDEFLQLLRQTITSLTASEKNFEKVLCLAIKKLGTDEGALTRVVTTRAEVDLHSIKQEYHRRISVPLDQEIVKDTSGDYEKFLVELVGHGDA
ncbi:unnamed protein product [Prunus armeniaca]|uniref:Annexin n=1 Tax=Prunus armeniaca TaxID=36596 RepID=A0A6J5XPW2_PRUAR|nr:unnamed protein product [Prunus armeniaca]